MVRCRVQAAATRFGLRRWRPPRHRYSLVRRCDSQALVSVHIKLDRAIRIGSSRNELPLLGAAHSLSFQQSACHLRILMTPSLANALSASTASPTPRTANVRYARITLATSACRIAIVSEEWLLDNAQAKKSCADKPTLADRALITRVPRYWSRQMRRTGFTCMEVKCSSLPMPRPKTPVRAGQPVGTVVTGLATGGACA